MIKLFIADIDGTLTDGKIYYNEEGEETKAFYCRDGRAFHLLNERGIITCIMTDSISKIDYERFLKVTGCKYFIDGNSPGNKLFKIQILSAKLDVELKNIAFIGDDTNDIEALQYAGIAACPCDAVQEILDIPDMHIMPKKGGNGAVRAFVDYLIAGGLV